MARNGNFTTLRQISCSNARDKSQGLLAVHSDFERLEDHAADPLDPSCFHVIEVALILLSYSYDTRSPVGRHHDSDGVSWPGHVVWLVRWHAEHGPAGISPRYLVTAASEYILQRSCLVASICSHIEQ